MTSPRHNVLAVARAFAEHAPNHTHPLGPAATAGYLDGYQAAIADVLSRITDEPTTDEPVTPDGWTRTDEGGAVTTLKGPAFTLQVFRDVGFVHLIQQRTGDSAARRAIITETYTFPLDVLRALL